MRQVAWLRSRPRDKAKKFKANETPPTRLEKIESNGGSAEFPVIAQGEYLIGYLWQVGTVSAGGMGPSPLTFSEMESWAHLTGIVLTPWQAQMLRKLSEAYIAESMEAENQDAPMPYGHIEETFDRDRVAKKVSNLFKALARIN